MLCARPSHTCARTMGLEWVKDVHSHIQARLEKDALLVMSFYTCMHNIHSNLERFLYRVSRDQYILSTDGSGGIHQHHISCEFQNPGILLLTILICCCSIFYRFRLSGQTLQEEGHDHDNLDYKRREQMQPKALAESKTGADKKDSLCYH